jgi:uncharacterized protein YjiS (DUF1127 family)
MKHIDPMTLAEIGPWQGFPPQSSLRRALAQMAGHYGAWISISRERSALANLDDRLLHDVGLTRYDAAREAAKPFWRK